MRKYELCEKRARLKKTRRAGRRVRKNRPGEGCIHDNNHSIEYMLSGYHGIAIPYLVLVYLAILICTKQDRHRVRVP